MGKEYAWVLVAAHAFCVVTASGYVACQVWVIVSSVEVIV
jgi:hypothetical protein